MQFRYRYVDYGTVFQARSGVRPEDARDDDPPGLFENELALDVGGVCWGRHGERLSVIDHHFQGSGQFPSASAAVLHMAPAVRMKFKPAGVGLVWLVTHKKPDFDAFCSMYLARILIEDHELVWPDSEHPIDWFALRPR